MTYDPRLIDRVRSFACDVAGDDDALPDTVLTVVVSHLKEKLDKYKARPVSEFPNVTRLLELRSAFWLSDALAALERVHEGLADWSAVAHLGLTRHHSDLHMWCSRQITEKIFLRRFVRNVVCESLKTDALSTAVRVALILYNLEPASIVDEMTSHWLSASSRQPGENVQRLDTPAQRARDSVLRRFPYLVAREATTNEDLRQQLATWEAFDASSWQAREMTAALNRIAQLTPCWVCTTFSSRPTSVTHAPVL